MWQADAHSLPGPLPALKSCAEGWWSLQVLKGDKIPQSLSPQAARRVVFGPGRMLVMGETPADHHMGIETTVRTRAAPTFQNPTGTSGPRPTGAGLARGPLFKTTWRFFPPFL